MAIRTLRQRRARHRQAVQAANPTPRRMTREDICNVEPAEPMDFHDFLAALSALQIMELIDDDDLAAHWALTEGGGADAEPAEPKPRPRRRRQTTTLKGPQPDPTPEEIEAACREIRDAAGLTL